MRVSFTGSRKGLTDKQKRDLNDFLSHNKKRIVLTSHGCCVGADVQFHEIARRVCGKSLFIAVYPSTAKTKAPVPGDADYVAPPAPPLERNLEIIDVGNTLLLVCPGEMQEMLRSGTWACKRAAQKRKIPYKIFWPSEGEGREGLH